MTDFDENRTNSIKSTAIEKSMLMFSKTSLNSFVYDILDVFCFPDEIVKKIYEKYNI